MKGTSPSELTSIYSKDYQILKKIAFSAFEDDNKKDDDSLDWNLKKIKLFFYLILIGV